MKYISKEMAEKAGQELIILLEDPMGWEVISGHDGLLWNMHLYKLGMSLYFDSSCGFSVSMSDSVTTQARVTRWYVYESFACPNEAIKAQVEVLRKEMSHITHLIACHLPVQQCTGMNQLFVRIFGPKAPQRLFCEATGIPQSTVTSWNGVKKMSTVMNILLRLIAAAHDMGCLSALWKRANCIKVHQETEKNGEQ